jgi:histone H3
MARSKQLAKPSEAPKPLTKEVTGDVVQTSDINPETDQNILGKAVPVNEDIQADSDEVSSEQQGTTVPGDKKKKKKRKSASNDGDKEVSEQKKKKKKKESNVTVKAGVKKVHKYRAGTVALREIKNQQKSTDNCIRKLPFQRLVREIAQDYKTDLRFTEGAFEALIDSSETFLVEFFDAGGKMLRRAKRQTLLADDMKMVSRIDKSIANSIPQYVLDQAIAESKRAAVILKAQDPRDVPGLTERARKLNAIADRMKANKK